MRLRSLGCANGIHDEHASNISLATALAAAASSTEDRPDINPLYAASRQLAIVAKTPNQCESHMRLNLYSVT